MKRNAPVPAKNSTTRGMTGKGLFPEPVGSSPPRGAPPTNRFWKAGKLRFVDLEIGVVRGKVWIVRVWSFADAAARRRREGRIRGTVEAMVCARCDRKANRNQWCDAIV